MKNIVLIGMPGAGKSTVGVVLAKNLGMSFMDSDLVIQEQEKKKLHELIEEFGSEGFLKIEERVNSTLKIDHTILATGGSAVYSEKAMTYLSQIGTICYLKLSYQGIAERLGDLTKRGVVLKPGQTLKDLYEERIPLYEKYAALTVECDNRSIRQIVEEIAEYQNQIEE